MKKVKQIINRFLGLFPSRLPVGMTEFDKWAKSVIEMSPLPYNDSTVFSLATMVLHLPATTNYKSKEYFIRSLHKAAANQIAAGVMQDLKEKQRAAQEAAAKANKEAIEVKKD